MTIQQLSSLLTVVSAVITAIVAVYIHVGPAPCIALAFVSVLSIACWLKFSFFSEPSRERIVSLYIFAIVLNLVLSTCRYWSEFPHFVAENWRSWFAPTFPITDVSWFVGFVTCPVTLMLLGGYCLVKRMPLGSYLAWWTFIYAIVDALVQIKVGVLGPNAHGYPDVAASVAATAQMVVGLLGCQRLLQEKPSRREFSYSGTTPTLRELNLWSALLVSLVAIYAVALYMQAGLLPVGVITGSMMGGLIAWRKTTARFPADPYKFVPLYLLLLALFYIHVGEEALTSFNQAIASISGTPWPDREFTYLIALIGPIVWVGGGLSLWLRQPFGNYVLWFMIVGMILGEPTHLIVFPVVAMYKYGIGYQYFSGMYTALFPMIPAIIALVTIVADHKQRQAAPSHA